LEKEQELKKSETKFRQVLENIRLIGLMLDTNANIIFANDFLLELTGWKREEIIGKNWFEVFIPAELISEITRIFDQTIKQGEFPLHHINDIVTKNGKRLAIKWSNTTHLNDEKKPISITSIGEDITQQIKTEKELNKHREKLEELVKERTIELEKAMHDMEKMNELFIGREFRIKELKDEIRALKEKYEH
jgi:PAS domain S-box-containing protein